MTEVLDFTKPVRFDLSEANINDICRASAAAAWAGSASMKQDTRTPAAAKTSTISLPGYSSL